MSHDTAALLHLATSTAAQAAALIVDGLSRARTLVDTKTTGTDMVTEMDKASEALILGRLTTERPDDAVLGEEGTDRPGSTGVRWIVDPIDGTTNYLYGHAGFAISIAAEIDGEMAIGVVHDFMPRSSPPFVAKARSEMVSRSTLPLKRSCLMRWSQPASPTSPIAVSVRQQCSARSSDQFATSAVWARHQSTCARLHAAGSMPITNAACNLGITLLGRSLQPRRAHSSAISPAEHPNLSSASLRLQRYSTTCGRCSSTPMQPMRNHRP